MKTVNEIYKLNGALVGLDVYGLELEIEDIQHIGDEFGPFSTRVDGSLRNNGTEFVSDPLPMENVEPALTTLFKNIRFGKQAFSERTSIHVHCNMKGCTVEQLKSFILLYIVFENVLFNYVDEKRKENIFCVALKDFACPERLAASFGPLENEKLLRPPQIHWDKYSALNILPLASFGTLEFRHMHGTNNVNYITDWVRVIHTLKQACREFPLEELRTNVRELNTSSQYMMFAEKVFSPVQNILFNKMDSSSFKKAMYSTVTLAKLWEFHEQQYKKNQSKKKVVEEEIAAPQIGDWIVFNDQQRGLNRARPGDLAAPVRPEIQPAPVNEMQRILNQDLAAVEARMREGALRRQAARQAAPRDEPEARARVRRNELPVPPAVVQIAPEQRFEVDWGDRERGLDPNW